MITRKKQIMFFQQCKVQKYFGSILNFSYMKPAVQMFNQNSFSSYNSTFFLNYRQWECALSIFDSWVKGQSYL